jgi:hypothetical protein
MQYGNIRERLLFPEQGRKKETFQLTVGVIIYEKRNL